MTGTTHETGGAGPSHRGVEIGVAGFIVLLAVIGIYGSLRVGIGWGAEGPRAGFFPFYISLIVLISCAINIWQALKPQRDDKVFADWGQLRKVFSVLVPVAIYVTLVPYIGIYAASVLLIGFFMRWLGRYPWTIVTGLALGAPILIFFIFEKWFLVPLPKGPLELLLLESLH